MIVENEGTITSISQEKTSMTSFLNELKEMYPKLKHNHIIVNLFPLNRVTVEDILQFLDISNTHRTSKKSFVLVTDKIAYDEIPEEIAVVPTFQEAKDLIEVEDMERDLEI